MTNDYTDHCQPIKQSISADTLSLSVIRSEAIFQEPVNQRINQLDGHQQSVNHLVSQTEITQKLVSQSVISTLFCYRCGLRQPVRQLSDVN